MTTRIATAYPALYRSLEEDPVTLPTEADPHLDVQALRKNLRTLQDLVAHYDGTRDEAGQDARS